MSSKSERPKKRKIFLVGGGFRWNRVAQDAAGGSMKAKRRAEMRLAKSKGKGALRAARAARKHAKKVARRLLA